MVNDLVGVPTTYGYHTHDVKNEGKKQGSQRGDNDYPKNQVCPGYLDSKAVLLGGTGNTLVSFSLSVFCMLNGRKRIGTYHPTNHLCFQLG